MAAVTADQGSSSSTATGTSDTATPAVAASSKVGSPPRTDAGLAWTRAAKRQQKLKQRRRIERGIMIVGRVPGLRLSTWQGKGKPVYNVACGSWLEGVWVYVDGVGSGRRRRQVRCVWTRWRQPDDGRLKLVQGRAFYYAKHTKKPFKSHLYPYFDIFYFEGAAG